MGFIAFPSVNNLKLAGANIVPAPTDTGNGGYGNRACFYDTWRLWNWTGWIKPQVDAAHANGCNFVRMQGDFLIRYGTGSGDYAGSQTFTWNGTISMSTYQTQVAQLINYLASLGMYFYATGGDLNLIKSTISSSTVNSYLTEYAGIVSSNSFSNVIGIDLMQEIDGGGGWSSNALSNAGTLITNARAALTVSMPLTCSLNGASSVTNLTPASNTGYATLHTAGVDFFDAHVYYITGATDFNAAIANSYHLPVFCGEMGIDFNAAFNGTSTAQSSTHPYTSEIRQDYYTAMRANASRYDMQGLGAWAITQEWDATSPGPPSTAAQQGQNWGFYSSHLNGSNQFDTPNTEETYQLGQFPVTPLAANAPWVPDLTFANTTAGSAGTAYGVQSRMLDIQGSKWTIVSNQIVGAGDNSHYYELLQNAVPPAQNQQAYFEIPKNPTVTRDGGRYVQWCAVLRAVPAGEYYVLELTSDNMGTFDAKFDIYYCSNPGTATSLASVTYAGGLDLTQGWSILFQASGVSPTTLTATLTNLTTMVSQTPLTVNDSTSAVQASTGGGGLACHLGTAPYVNVQLTWYRQPTPGTVSNTGATTTSISLSATNATGTTGSYTYQWQSRLNAAGGPWTNISGATSLTLTNTGLSPGTAYDYQMVYTDSGGNTSTAQLLDVLTSSSSLAHYACTYII
jgi:hypothetical protein